MNTDKRTHTLKRSAAFLIDAGIFMIPIILVWYLAVMSISDLAQPTYIRVALISMSLSLITLFFICLKDIFGVSIGKKIMKLRIISIKNDTGSVKIISRVLRNLTFPVWPLELIFIATTGTRLSDRILGLRVANAEDT